MSIGNNNGELWELNRVDWTLPHGNNKIDRNDIIKLLSVETEDEARHIRGKIEYAICFNEGLFDLATPVVRVILSVLPNLNPIAKETCLDLLAIIVFSEPVDGKSNVKNDCIKELMRSLWYFLYEFQFGEKRYIKYYIAILSALAENYLELENVIKFYINQYESIHGVNPIDVI